MPFTLRNLKEDLEDLGSRFDGAPDLEFRLAIKALELEKSGLGYQRVPPGTWRGYEAGPEGLEILVIGAPNLGEAPREDVEGQRDFGFTPWEQTARLPAADQIAALFAREEAGREPPYGQALDLGCGSQRGKDEGPTHSRNRRTSHRSFQHSVLTGGGPQARARRYHRGRMLLSGGGSLAW